MAKGYSEIIKLISKLNDEFEHLGLIISDYNDKYDPKSDETFALHFDKLTKMYNKVAHESVGLLGSPGKACPVCKGSGRI